MKTIYVLFALVILHAVGCAQTKVSTDSKPNIVLIVADDMGWGDVGYHGGVAKTPAIDRLAEEGVRFNQFYVAPLCSPTRAGLLTGRWPIRTGMAESVITPWRKHGMPTTEHTLAELLGEAGYTRRAIIGKWHLGHYQRQYLPLNRGFTYFYGLYNGEFDYFTKKREGELDWYRGFESSTDPGYATDLIGKESVRFIKESNTEDPFLLYVAFTAPHTPLQAKPEDIAKYAHVEGERQRIYLAMIDSMDQWVAKILDALDEKDVADNTFVMFFTDNGGVQNLGNNAPWRGAKDTVYEGGIRVPAVARWPQGGLTGGGSIDAMTGYIDLYPTFKRMAGIETLAPNPLDGRDMLDVYQGNAEPTPRPWFSYVAKAQPDNIALLDGDWKLVITGGSVLDLAADGKPIAGAKDKPRVELFNLTIDPHEQTNLAAKQSKIVARLLAQLQEHRRLKPAGVPDFMEGRESFVAPKNWLISE